VVPPTAWSRRAARLRNLSPKRENRAANLNGALTISPVAATDGRPVRPEVFSEAGLLTLRHRASTPG